MAPFETAIIERYKRMESSVEDWRNRPITGEYPYVFVDGIYIKCSWGREMTSESKEC